MVESLQASPGKFNLPNAQKSKRPLYSHSRLSSFENCPQLFKYRYLDKIKTESEGVEAFMGKRVHEVLERLYHHVGRYGRPPSLNQVQDRFRKDWPLHWHENIVIVREGLDTEHYIQLGVRCLENYYRSYYPFDQGETIGIEKNVLAKLDDAGAYRIRGIIDRVVRTAPGCYEVHDYKTGGYVPPRKKLDLDRQLALYQIGIQQTYDDVEEVRLVWHYVAFGKTLTSSRTPEALECLKNDTISLIDHVETTAEFKATPSKLCNWCEFRDLCPDAKLDRPSAAPSGPEPPLPLDPSASAASNTAGTAAATSGAEPGDPQLNLL